MMRMNAILHKAMQYKWKVNNSLTTEEGASACWHMTQGTPVSKDTAMFAAQLM